MTNFDRLYELAYTPLVTPYNILSNIKLSNYEYINFYKEEMMTVAEMKCKCVGDTNYKVFYYYFDKEDSLINIYVNINGNKHNIFNRDYEYQEKKKELLKEFKTESVS